MEVKGCEKVERPVHKSDGLPDIDQDHPGGGLTDPVGSILVGSGQHGTLVPCSLVGQEGPEATDPLGHRGTMHSTHGRKWSTGVISPTNF